MKCLASVGELSSLQFKSFMSWINAFARVHGLRVHTNHSTIWEYPWSWQHLSDLCLPGAQILDIGSQLSPMPWFFASLGARVTMVETDPCYVAKWAEINDRNSFGVRWHVISGSFLPIADETFDLITYYSLIGRLQDKPSALDEAARVLKPGGFFCLAFDVCESSRGMTFPERSGTPLDMKTFDRLVGRREDLEPVVPGVEWNIADIDAFLEWHRSTAPDRNYVVGGALMRRRKRIPSPRRQRKPRSLRVHQLDTGVGSGNTGDDAMSSLPVRVSLRNLN